MIFMSRTIDESFYICSHVVMTRIDDDILSTHIEVALAGAAPTLLDDLADADRARRRIAVTRIAHHLAERLRCFDIRSPEPYGDGAGQSSLFPQDLGPIGLHTT